MEQRLKAALAAARWLGTREGSREHRMILDAYNAIRPLPRGYAMTAKDPWCAAFVSAAAVMAGIGALVPLECSCSRIIEKARKMGIWVEDDEYRAEIGDWVLYNWQAKDSGDDTGAPDHVGIVIGWETGSMLVAEGNYEQSVKLRQLPRDGRYIRGFVCPRYGNEGSGTVRYHTLQDVPEYARPTIEKLTREGSLLGVAEDDLGLTEELIRILVILDRRGVL